MNNMNIIEEKLKQLDTKVNYAIALGLRSKGQDVRFPNDVIEWVNGVKQLKPSDVIKAVELIIKLLELGYSVESLIEQFKYVKDLQALDQITEILTSLLQHDSDAFDILSVIFNGCEARNYLNTIERKEQLKLIDKNKLGIDEGYVVITINELAQIKDGYIYYEEEKTITVSIKEQAEKNEYIYEFISLDGVSISLSIPFDKVVGLESITRLKNNGQHILHVLRKNGRIMISGMVLTLDIEGKAIAFLEGDSVDASGIWDSLINQLPTRLQIVSTGITLQLLNGDLSKYHEEVLVQYIEGRIYSIKSELVITFNDQFSKDITYGLYGQATLVALSTLSESLKSVVRRINSSYEITKTLKDSIIPVPEEVMKYELPQEWDSKLDVFGQCGVPPKRVDGRETYLLGSVKYDDYPTFKTSLPAGAHNKTGFSLSDYRLNAKTGIMRKTRSDKTTYEQPFFLEGVVNVINQKPAVPGAYCLSKGVLAEGVDISSIVTAPADDVIRFNALVLTVNSNLLPFGQDEVDLKTYIGAKIEATVEKLVRLVIIADDVIAADGTPPTATVSVIHNGEEKKLTAVMEFQSLQFGEAGFKNCYVGNLFSSVSDETYLIGMEVNAHIRRDKGNSCYTRIERDFKPGGIGEFFPGSTIRVDPHVYSTINWQIDKDFIRPVVNITRESVFWPRNVKYEPQEGASYVLPGSTWPFIDTKNYLNYKYYWVVLVPIHKEVIGNQYVGNITGFSPIDNFDLHVNWLGDATNIPMWSRNVEYYQYKGTREWVKSKWVFNDYTVKKPFPKFTNTVEISVEGQPINLEINKIDLTTSEVVLPDETLNQDAIGQSILDLQRSVRMLEYYAAYITYYLTNLDKRLEYVEATVNRIVEVLNELLNPPKVNVSPWDIALGVLNFVGQGIGLFFPLIGIAISAVGLLVSGIRELSQGDVLAGTFDIVFSILLTLVSAFELPKSLRLKYGDGALKTLEPKHKLNNLVELPGTVVTESRLINIIKNNLQVKNGKSNTYIKTSNIVEANEASISFHSGTLILSALERSKCAKIVTKYFPLNLNDRTFSFTCNRDTTYTLNSGGNYTLLNSTSVIKLTTYLKSDRSFDVIELTDADIQDLTTTDLTIDDFSSYADAVCESKRIANSNSLLGVDSSVLGHVTSKLGYDLSITRGFVNQEFSWKWPSQLSGMSDKIDCMTSPSDFYLGLNPIYSNQNSQQILCTNLLG